ncbi:PREDICTED: uncharacterized protein LOC109181172 [Ipomoea nil]|uniref:uncharacterized protein LOC109181172 n=1 Tax=Ipomoea nil TaxID=35883 RepID=UPI000900C181|nr:PREDICTED: uncharacterized protein LOC109181172 [Ipomoea nil]
MDSEDSPGRCSRKLDFSAPLLSTRRPPTPRKRGLILPAGSGDNPAPLAVDVNNRIPFSWEQIPGKPKETDDQASSDDVPLPKPPPGRWYPRNYGGSRSDCDCCEQRRHCDNYDGDVEDGGNRELRYSDALDVFSLGESSSSSDNNAGDGDNNNGNNVGGDRTMCLAAGGNFEPDLIFLRFLKDAKALAAESLINGCDVNETAAYAASDHHHHRSGSCFARALSAGQGYEYSSCSKACGLDIFLPWRMKPKPCGGVRNSVVAAAASPRLKPPQWGTRKPQDHI